MNIKELDISELVEEVSQLVIDDVKTNDHMAIWRNFSTVHAFMIYRKKENLLADNDNQVVERYSAEYKASVIALENAFNEMGDRMRAEYKELSVDKLLQWIED